MSAAGRFPARLQARAARALNARRTCRSAEWPPASVVVERDGELEVVAGMPSIPQAARWARAWATRTGEAPLYVCRTSHATRPVAGVIESGSPAGGSA